MRKAISGRGTNTFKARESDMQRVFGKHQIVLFDYNISPSTCLKVFGFVDLSLYVGLSFTWSQESVEHVRLSEKLSTVSVANQRR